MGTSAGKNTRRAGKLGGHSAILIAQWEPCCSRIVTTLVTESRNTGGIRFRQQARLSLQSPSPSPHKTLHFAGTKPLGGLRQLKNQKNEHVSSHLTQFQWPLAPRHVTDVNAVIGQTGVRNLQRSFTSDLTGGHHEQGPTLRAMTFRIPSFVASFLPGSRDSDEPLQKNPPPARPQRRCFPRQVSTPPRCISSRLPC